MPRSMESRIIHGEAPKSVPTRRRRLSSPLRLLPLAVLFVQEGRGVERFTISDFTFPYRFFLSPPSIRGESGCSFDANI